VCVCAASHHAYTPHLCTHSKVGNAVPPSRFVCLGLQEHIFMIQETRGTILTTTIIITTINITTTIVIITTTNITHALRAGNTVPPSWFVGLGLQENLFDQGNQGLLNL